MLRDVSFIGLLSLVLMVPSVLAAEPAMGPAGSDSDSVAGRLDVFGAESSGHVNLPADSFTPTDGAGGAQGRVYADRSSASATERNEHDDGELKPSLPLSALGPLPPNTSSRYLETKGTGILLDRTGPRKEWAAKFVLHLDPKPGLPFETLLEAQFEDPDHPNSLIVATSRRERGKDDIMIMSPEFRGLRCQNYEVTIYVYWDDSKADLLGVHRQTIQSRINLSKVNAGLVDAVEANGKCP